MPPDIFRQLKEAPGATLLEIEPVQVIHQVNFQIQLSMAVQALGLECVRYEAYVLISARFLSDTTYFLSRKLTEYNQI
jgi:hypothetical protein